MGTETVVAVDVIETFAGNGKSRSTGDGKRAIKAGIPLPNQVTVEREGRYLYIAECGSDRVRRVDIGYLGITIHMANHIHFKGMDC
jgi:DNA-binding beta-propeller fold protein YncE